MNDTAATLKQTAFVILLLLLSPAAYSIVQPQPPGAPIGAKVVSATTDGHNIIIAVENVSNKDITAVHISTKITYQDGKTGSPQWEWDLASARTERAFRAAHHMPLLDAPQKGILHPGERSEDSLQWDLLPNNPLVRVSAVVDVVVYADGTSDVHNQEAFQMLLRRRRGLANVWGPTVDFESANRQSTSSASPGRKAKDEFFSNKRLAPIEKRPTAASSPEIAIPAALDVTALPALPVQQSDFVVIGTVGARRAFLSQDKTGVYSEVEVQVEKVLKGDGSVSTRHTIVAQRPGGIVQFTDGTIQTYKVPGEDWPIAQRRYALFLKNSPVGDFDLLTGYELCGGVVYPLDGAGENRFSSAAYSGMKEGDFLAALIQAISAQGDN